MVQERQQKEIVRSVSIKSRRNLRLAARIHGPIKGCPVLVVAHGLMSSKSSPRHLLLANEAIQRGLSVLRFDFAGRGNSAGTWADVAPLGQVDDLLGVLDYLKEHGAGPILLYGSSLGGWTALKAASLFPVQAVATWAAVADFRQMGLFANQKLLALWKKQGFIDFQGGKVPYSFYEQAFSIAAASGRPNCPCFIAHGTADEVVPFESAQKMAAALPKATFVEIVNGDHRLLDMERRTALIKQMVIWLAEQV